MSSHVMNNHQDVSSFNFACRLCKVRFKSMNDLNHHMDSQHQVNSERELNLNCFYCKDCNKSFKREADFENHKKSKHGPFHQKARKYFCQKCENVFPSVSALKEHDEINHENDFLCVMCKIEFKSLSEMDSHMDDEHEGRWKKYDPDVLKEGDEESESSVDFTDSDDSKSEER